MMEPTYTSIYIFYRIYTILRLYETMRDIATPTNPKDITKVQANRIWKNEMIYGRSGRLKRVKNKKKPW